VNALNRANLRFHLIDGDGFTVVTVAEATPQGQPESATQVLLPGRANLVRVTETNAPTETQMYRMTVQTGAGLTLTASAGTFEDRVVLSWSTIPGSDSYTVFRGTTTDRGAATAIATRTQTNYTDTTAVRGTTYFYWVQAHQFVDYAVDLGGPVQGFRTPPPPCPGDFNQDGVRNPDDLSEFITCFFLNLQFPGFCGSADFNLDSLLNPDDLSEFITVFFLFPC
jgi:hypothetical protein